MISLYSNNIYNNNCIKKVFLRNKTHDVENTVLPFPVIIRVLRIVAVEWNPHRQVCLRLEALGCPVSQGMWSLLYLCDDARKVNHYTSRLPTLWAIIKLANAVKKKKHVEFALSYM